IDEGHLSYCKEDGNIYQYKSANTVDATTGRWRLFKTEADAALNGTSTNAIQNKAVFDALKTKADAAALAAYQPKYKADYIAKEDLSELPITKGILDLNGHSIYMHDNSYDGELTIQNGTILRIGKINAALNIINCTIERTDVEAVNEYNVTFNYSNIKRLFTNESIYCHIFNSNVGYLACDCNSIYIYNSTVDELTCYTYGYNNVVIGNSYISTITHDPYSQPRNDGSIYLYNCFFETLGLDNYPRSIGVQLCSCCDYSSDITYVNGYYDNANGLKENAYTTIIENGNDLAPTSDAVYNALGAYQPKYKADYVAQSDILVGALPNDTKGVDLNGFTLNITEDTTLTRSFIINGTIAVADTCTLTLAVDNCSNVIIKKSGTKDIYIVIEKGNFDTCNFGGTTKIISTSNYEIRNSIFQNDLNILGSGSTDVLYSTIYGNINLNNVNSTVAARWCTIAGEVNVLHTGRNFSSFTYCELAGVIYICATLTENGDYNEVGTINIVPDDTAPVSSKAVYEALQLKADKTQLNNYVTTATANSTYAKKSDITNIYKFKGTKTNYADLPTTNRVTGDVWNITNANAEHGIKAGDNVAWNGTAWDNLSGTVDLSAYATTTTTDAMSADIKKLMDKAFPFTVKVSINNTLVKKGTSQPVKVTITPKIGDDNTNVDTILINGAEYHGATPYVYSATATTTTTYNVRVSKEGRTAQGSATITFVNPSYDGAVAANFTATEANIKALTETLRSGKGETRTFSLNNQKACIAYPKAFGAATGIKDANGFDYLASYTRSELNVNGELYYVYLMTNATTITGMTQTVS
ncbi:MAG: hypothetical protein SPG97_02445, partial [Bacilli bacterium]|nr:hypothetical protein [Bacilli bacterium]